MAGSMRIKLNSKGIKALLSSADVRRDLDARAKRIAAQAEANAGAEDGPVEFAVSHTTMRDRAAVRVVAADIKARVAEAQDAALTRAIDAGRG